MQPSLSEWEEKDSNEVPTLKLPKTPHHMNVSKRKSPKKRVQLCVQKSSPNVKPSQLALTFNGRPE